MGLTPQAALLLGLLVLQGVLRPLSGVHGVYGKSGAAGLRGLLQTLRTGSASRPEKASRS